MAARRLLIVMLVLLGLSTLAAALVPQHGLRDATTTSTTKTQPTTTTAEPPPGRSLTTPPIVVGGKKVPVVAGPVCSKTEPKCEPPIHVGDQISLQVFTRKGQAALEIPTYGLFGIASQNAPAFFNLLPQQPGNIGILFSPSHKVAVRVQVLTAKAAKAQSRKANKKRAAKSRARGGSGPP
jgi:hypothetical protein